MFSNWSLQRMFPPFPNLWLLFLVVLLLVLLVKFSFLSSKTLSFLALLCFPPTSFSAFFIKVPLYFPNQPAWCPLMHTKTNSSPNLLEMTTFQSTNIFLEWVQSTNSCFFCLNVVVFFFSLRVSSFTFR